MPRRKRTQVKPVKPVTETAIDRYIKEHDALPKSERPGLMEFTYRSMQGEEKRRWVRSYLQQAQYAGQTIDATQMRLGETFLSDTVGLCPHCGRRGLVINVLNTDLVIVWHKLSIASGWWIDVLDQCDERGVMNSR